MIRPRSLFLGRLFAIALILSGTLPGFTSFRSSPALAASQLHYLYGSGSTTGGKTISLRVELSEPAPAGGVLVSLASDSALIPVPGSVTVIAGATETTIQVETVPTPVTTDVRVSASYGGVTKSRTVTILKPYLKSISAQSKMRAGGQGKITVNLSGRAYTCGIDVSLISSRPEVVAVPAIIHFEPGQASYTLIVDPTDQSPDIPVTFIASFDNVQHSDQTIVRSYSSDGTATATPTALPRVQRPQPTILARELRRSLAPTAR